MSSIPIMALTPMAHVANVARSIDFYARLGLEPGGSFTPPGENEPSWVSLVSGGAELMLARADVPVDRGENGVIFYLYCEDAAGMHRELSVKGVNVGEITTPFYKPAGEFRIADPDGHVIYVTHT